MCIFFFSPPVAVCFPSIWSTICNEGLVAFQSRRLIDKISCQENREREKKLNGVSFFKGAAALVYLPQSIFLLLLTFKVRFRILFKPKHIIYYVFSQQFQTTKCCNKMSLRLTDIANRAPSSHLSIILFLLFCLSGIWPTMTELYEVLPCARNHRLSPFSGSTLENNLVEPLTAGFK